MDVTFTGYGVVATPHEIHEVCPPPSVTCITEVIRIQHAGQDKAALVDDVGQLFEKRCVICKMVEDRKVRRDCMHLARERRGNGGNGFAGDFGATVLRQVFAHRL